MVNSDYKHTGLLTKVKDPFLASDSMMLDRPSSRNVAGHPDASHAPVGPAHPPVAWLVLFADRERHDGGHVAGEEVLAAGLQLPGVLLRDVAEAGGQQPLAHLFNGLQQQRGVQNWGLKMY